MKGLALVLFACAFACGCTGSATCRTTIQILPGQKPGEYVVSAKVRTTRTSWCSARLRELSVPTITCLAGTPASASVSTDDGQSGIFLDAFVAKPGDDKPSTCSLTVKEHGEVVSSTDLRLPPLAP